MKITNNIPFDCSTNANFNSWASTFSANLATLGFIQQNDTGQAVWNATSLTLTQAVVSGGNVVYHYSAGYTGPALRIGMALTVAGFTNGGNNVTLQPITAFTGTSGAGGTFTIVNGSGVNESHAATAVTVAESSVPSVQATVTNGLYEIWASGDSLTTFYFKVEYGQCAASVPGMAITFGTSTNGSGTLGGNTSTREFLGYASATAEGSKTYECDFCSAQQSSTTPNGSNLSCLMWRTQPTTTQGGFLISFERSKNSSGADTNQYITYVVGPGGGAPQQISPVIPYHQCSVFLSGSPATGIRDVYCLCLQQNGMTTSWQLGNAIAASPVYPNVGYLDYYMLGLLIMQSHDVSDGSTFTNTMYGASHTFLLTKTTYVSYLAQTGVTAVGIRWE
jgi:hypothetical protein